MRDSWYSFKPFINHLFYWFSADDIGDFHLDKVSELNLLKTKELPWSFRCRFLYWIYDKVAQKWWIRYHWLPITEFYIEIWMQEVGYYDCLVWAKKWVYTDLKSRYKWQLMDKSKFKFNETWELFDTKNLYYSLIRFWATTTFIKELLKWAKSDWKWNSEYKLLFFNQLKILKWLIKDKDRDEMRDYPTQNVNREYFEKFWYVPEEKYVKNYYETLDYLWIENRVLRNSNIEEKIMNEMDLEKRKEITSKEFKKLFPNEKFKNIW